MSLSSGRVFQLPDDVELDDDESNKQLDDIRRALHPRFSPADLATLDAGPPLILETTPPRIRGAVGLDAMHAASNAPAAVLHLVLRPKPVRNALLLHAPQHTHQNPSLYDALVNVCSSMWADAAFRPHIAPHAFMQLLSRAVTDPADILAWLLNTAAISKGTSSETRAFSKLLKKTFQGAMCVTSHRTTEDTDKKTESLSKNSAFWFLPLDLPPKPLFKHEADKDTIPQVSLEKLLEKFNGVNHVHVIETGATKSYRIVRTPRYLFLVVKRFSKSKFGTEKNPTIVHLPSDVLDMGNVCNSVQAKYSLIGAVSHEGSLEKGRFKTAIFHEASKSWYDVTDIAVEKTVFQLIALRDSYILLYEIVEEGDTLS